MMPPGPVHKIALAPRIAWILGAVAVILYFVLSIGNSLTRSPWWDEGVFADVAGNFALHGHFGSRILDPKGCLDFVEVHKYTYWQFPAYLALLGYWFRIFGEGILAMRMLSVILGALLVGSWFTLVRKLTGNTTIAILAASLIALDHSVLSSASNGRMDIMAAALGACALAVYVSLRERNLTYALLAAGIPGCAALLSHPMGLIYSIDLATVILWLDWRRLRFVHLAALAGSYSIGLAIEAMHIMQAPEIFSSQMNAVSYRVGGMMGALRSLASDLSNRYWFYYFSSLPGIYRAKAFSLLLAAAGLIGISTTKQLRQQPGVSLLLILSFTSLVMVALIDNQRYPIYFIHSFVPVLAVAAAWAYDWWHRGSARRAVAAICVAGTFGASVAAYAIKIKQNPYADYLQMIETVNSNLGSGGTVMGGSEIGFANGFRPPLIDDRHLGYFSGIKPDVYVDNNYYEVLMRPRETLQKHVRDTLQAEYKIVLSNREFRVWVRHP